MAVAKLRLGKLPPKADPRNLKLRTYLAADMPPPPASCNWLGGSSPPSPMLANDRVGCCVFASMAHQTRGWTGVSRRKPVTITDRQVLAAYSEVTGYNAADPSTDQGTYWLDGLKHWRKTGIAGHKINAFVQLKQGSMKDIQTAVWLFGGVALGINMPLTALDQIDAGGVWWVSSAKGRGEAGTWGGHAVPVVCYTQTRVWCVTWGQLQQMTWEFVRAYADEAFAAISETDWLTGGKSPGGFNFAKLTQDLGQLAA